MDRDKRNKADPGAAPARIVLVGFMGAGKTTVGRLLAERLEWELVDFDEEIERLTGQSVAQIFERDGEAKFRRFEAEFTRGAIDAERAVLVSGGGWMARPDLRELLPADSLVVWLRVSADEAVRRLREDPKTRPLLTVADPLERARELLAAREPAYQRADEILDVDDRTPDDVANEISRMLSEASAQQESDQSG